MSVRTYSVVAIENETKRLIIETSDALQAFDLVFQLTFKRMEPDTGILRYCVYDIDGKLLSQSGP